MFGIPEQFMTESAKRAKMMQNLANIQPPAHLNSSVAGHPNAGDSFQHYPNPMIPAFGYGAHSIVASSFSGPPPPRPPSGPPQPHSVQTYPPMQILRIPTSSSSSIPPPPIPIPPPYTNQAPVPTSRYSSASSLAVAPPAVPKPPVFVPPPGTIHRAPASVAGSSGPPTCIPPPPRFVPSASPAAEILPTEPTPHALPVTSSTAFSVQSVSVHDESPVKGQEVALPVLIPGDTCELVYADSEFTMVSSVKLIWCLCYC
mgnify:CR=1 FL=1